MNRIKAALAAVVVAATVVPFVTPSSANAVISPWNLQMTPEHNAPGAPIEVVVSLLSAPQWVVTTVPVFAEIETDAELDDGYSPQTPDMACSLRVGGSCTLRAPSPSGDWTGTVRAWVGFDGSDPDLTEWVYAGPTDESGRRGTGRAGRYREPDATDVVEFGDLNFPPHPIADKATTPYQTSVVVPVLANDVDWDGDELSIASVPQPNSGTVTVLRGGSVQYTPKSTFSGWDSFVYRVQDPSGSWREATASVKVAAPTDAPSAALTSPERNEIVSPALRGLVTVAGTHTCPTGPVAAWVHIVNANASYTYNTYDMDASTFRYEWDAGSTGLGFVSISANVVCDVPLEDGTTKRLYLATERRVVIVTV